jgi:AraC-like DNA-binding protein
MLCLFGLPGGGGAAGASATPSHRFEHRRGHGTGPSAPHLAAGGRRLPDRVGRERRAVYGETPYSYLMTRRIERAKALLRRGDLSVTEVCLAVGATSLGSFSTRFTELVGESPSAYRARNHSALAPIPACWAKLVTRPSRNREAQVSPAP